MYVSPVSMIKTRQKREKLSQFPRNECVAAFFTKEKKDTTLEHELSLAPIFLVIHWLIRTIFVEKSPIHISNRTSNTFFPRYDWLILAILPVLSRKDKQKYYSKIYQLVTSSCIHKKKSKKYNSKHGNYWVTLTRKVMTVEKVPFIKMFWFLDSIAPQNFANTQTMVMLNASTKGFLD